MLGFQAAGAAPLVTGQPVADPVTVASAIRIGNPASWELAQAARDESGGMFDAVTDEQILDAYRLLALREAVFGEPASAAGVAGLLQAAQAGQIRPGSVVVCTITGHRAKGPGHGRGRAARADDRRRPTSNRRRSRSDWLITVDGLVGLGQFEVRVPATSANLGPGFDSLGLALALHDVVEAQVIGEGLRIEVTGVGEPTAELGEGHLVVRAMRAAFDTHGRAAAGNLAALPERDTARLRARLVGGRDRGRPARGASACAATTA